MTHLLRAALALTTLALLTAMIPWSGGLASSSAAAGVTVALDADPSTVGSIEQCVSATVGQPVDIDIVIPSPGIPSDRGIAASQFTLFYDPDIVWIGADDSDMLLAQAQGSVVLPIQDPKPDKNGVYISWAVDFGAKGIEPGGASETGPGVISRITLLPQGKGLSDLVLQDVVIIDDASQKISVDSVQSGTIHVGEPCPAPCGSGGGGGCQQPTPTPTATPPGDGGGGPQATPTPTPTPTSTPTALGTTLTASEVTPTPAPFPAAGGGPSAGGGAPWWLIVSGLVAVLGGASLLIGRKLAFRRPNSLENDGQ